MPIFEYVCKKCNNQFEELVLGGDDAVACPACGSDKTEKLMSCCRSKMAGAGGGEAPQASASAPAAPSGGGCAGCSGGSCASCH